MEVSTNKTSRRLQCKAGIPYLLAVLLNTAKRCTVQCLESSETILTIACGSGSENAKGPRYRSEHGSFECPIE